MPTLRLEMIFKNQEGRNSKVSVDDAKSDLTEVEVNDAMDQILASDIFTSSGGDFVEKSKAELITTEVQEISIL